MKLNHKEAHKFVREQRRAGNDIRWENYTMVFFRPTRHGFTNVNGAFRKGRWGMEFRVDVDRNGQWSVPKKYVYSG